MRIRFAVRTGCHAVPQHKAYTAALCILLAFALLFAGVYITSALNEPEYYQGFSYTENDVTASEEMERNPNYLSGAKRQVYEFMYDFLRTPLTAMCGYIELMEREPQTENGKRYLAVMRTADQGALRRIFDNIISNAVKYSDGDFAVALDENGTATFTNGAVELSCVQAERLFDRFFTVETARFSTGLGLSIAKQLTEKLGGSIRAEYGGGKLQIRLSLLRY